MSPEIYPLRGSFERECAKYFVLIFGAGKYKFHVLGIPSIMDSYFHIINELVEDAIVLQEFNESIHMLKISELSRVHLLVV